MSEKKPLILFSGGVESTYILSTHYATGADTLEVALENSYTKVLREKRARDSIICQLNTIHTDAKICYNRRRTATYKFDDPTTMNAIQPMAWFAKAMEIVNPEAHSSVMIGYCADDDIGSTAPHLKYAWEHMWAVIRPQAELVPLEFPVILREKRRIVEELDTRLLPLTFSCEWVGGDPDSLVGCGSCTPCRERFQAFVAARRTEYLDPHTFHNSVKYQFGRDLVDAMLDTLVNQPPKPEKEKADDTLEKTSDVQQSPLGGDLPGSQPADLVQLPDQASVLGDDPVHAETAAVPA